MKYFFISLFCLAAMLAAGLFFRCDKPTAVAQEPRRWLSGDTLWYEIDSLPALPSPRDIMIDTLLHRWPILYPQSTPVADSFPTDRVRYAPVRFDYKIPFWSIYRRSVTVWGITFSTGQSSPFSPYVYPSEDYPSAEVLSFPLNHPK